MLNGSATAFARFIFFPQMTMNLIVLISVLNHIGFSGSRVAVSLYALELGANQFTIGVFIALYALCPVLLSIVIGKFADRVAPRLPAIIGTAGVGLALLLPPLFPGLTVLYVSSFVLGLSNQLINIPLEAIVGGIDGVEKRARNYALISMGFAGASFLGPLVAGFSIDSIGHLQVFLVLASFTVVPMLILWFKPAVLRKVARHAAEARRGSVLDLWRIPNLRTTLIAGSIALSAWDLFQFYLPIYGHSVGLSASAIGTILAVFSIASFVIRGTVPFLVKKLTEAKILTYSVFIAAFAFVLLPFFVSPYALAAIAFLLGLGVGCATPIEMSLIYVLTPRDRIAESMGLRKTVNQTMHLVIPLIFGSLGAAFGSAAVFISNSVMLTIGGFLMRKARLPDTDLRPK